MKYIKKLNTGIKFRLQEQFMPIHFQQSLRDIFTF